MRYFVIVRPRHTWANKEAYDAKLRQLAQMFIDNFAKYADNVSVAVCNAGPRLT